MATDYSFLREFCTTEAQTIVVEAVIAHHGNQSEAARSLGRSQSGIWQAINKLERAAASSAIAPHRDVDHPTMEGYQAKFVTSRYDGEGNLKGQYVRQEREKNDDSQEVLRSFVDGLLEELPDVHTPIKAPEITGKDRLNVFAIGDHHLGMHSYKPQTGFNYDVNIAENLLEQSFENLIARADKAEAAMFLNMGDFMHTDSESSTTAGTPQDTDGRYERTVRHARILMKRMIVRLLETYPHVYVLNIRGNHDHRASYFLNEIMTAYFENEPRITVLCNQKKFIPFYWGKVMMLTHHGDGINPQKMYEVATRNFREEWGSHPFVYGYTAHFHHKTVLELPGMVCEQMGVLCPVDKWHAAKGYGASRTMVCITHHKEFGEVGRVTFKAEMAE
mgnify:FL=1